MKKTGIILTSILVFISCMAFSYWLARQTAPAPPGSTLTPAPTRYQQINIILIHTENLQDKKPELKSVWLLFVYFSEPPKLTFLPVYPTNETRLAKSLHDAFTFNPDGSVAMGFWKAMGGYNFNWEGYAVIDNASLNTIGKYWVGKDFTNPLAAPALNPQAGTRTPAPTAVTQAGSEVIQKLCTQFGKPSTRSLGAFPWTEITPQHFRSDLKFSTVMVQWNFLVNANPPTRCEILPPSSKTP
ncbi:MAG TPA: hypothetical protein VIO61_13050 [Anaerolineaceae bacterium]